MRLYRLKSLIGVAVLFACTGAAAVTAVSSAAGLGRRTGHGILFIYRPHGRVLGGDVYDLVRGRGVRRLTDSPTAKYDPQWSPNGTRIAYTAMLGNGLSVCGPCTQEVWVARADGSHAHQVTSLSGAEATSDTHPSWSPNGRQIVFERDFAVPPLHQLLIVPARGGRERYLGVAGTEPTWGPRGIAYVAVNSIRLIRPSVRGSTLLAVAPTGVAALAWSGSDRLAALEGQAYGRHIVIFAASGRQLERLSLPAPLFGALGITWSPDGRQLLLSAWVRGAPPGLYETDMRGMKLRHIVARIDAWRAGWR